MVAGRLMRVVVMAGLLVGVTVGAGVLGAQVASEDILSPSRPVPVGMAPGMQIKLIKDSPAEKVYAVIFYKGDEVLSGLTDFAIQHHVMDAHFTAIGATSGATLAWLDVTKKSYHRIAVSEQAEVLSLIGDVAAFDGKPVVHMHAVLGKRDGSTVGGHVFELKVNPTLEVFVTVNSVELKKRPDDASGMGVQQPRSR